MTKNISNFVYRYWSTIALVMVLSILLRQNFSINQFPSSLTKKQAIVNENEKINQSLKQQNKTKILELQAYNAINMEILESQARYRFGLVKQGERYYKIIQSP